MLALLMKYDGAVGSRFAVDGDAGLRASADGDAIASAADAQRHGKAPPRRRQRRPDEEPPVLAADAEHVLDRDAIEPAGRAGVPGPAAAPGLVLAIDVGRDDVGLDTVMVGGVLVARVIDRIDHGEQAIGLV